MEKIVVIVEIDQSFIPETVIVKMCDKCKCDNELKCSIKGYTNIYFCCINCDYLELLEEKLNCQKKIE